MTIEIVDFPIKHGDFPVRYVDITRGYWESSSQMTNSNLFQKGFAIPPTWRFGVEKIPGLSMATLEEKPQMQLLRLRPFLGYRSACASLYRTVRDHILPQQAETWWCWDWEVAVGWLVDSWTNYHKYYCCCRCYCFCYSHYYHHLFFI